VVQENDYAIWNRSDPGWRRRPVDKKGVIRHQHIGEGGYEETRRHPSAPGERE